MRRGRLSFGCFAFSSLTALVGCSARSEVPQVGDSPAGDYGDAPDGTPLDPVVGGELASFPTKSKDGARVLDVNKAWLGSSGSIERGAEDPNDPDGRNNLQYDKDDGLDEMFVKLHAGKAQAELALDLVTSDATAKFWLNVLVDLNGDGRWDGAGAGGELEWPVQNSEVAFDGKTRTRVEIPPFAFSNGAHVPSKAWMRVALTDGPVPKPWDGSGQFGAGEIEDYFVVLPGSPLVDIDCENPDSGSGAWTFSGQRTASVTCRVLALNDKAHAKVPFVNLRTKGGVTQARLCKGAEVAKDSTEIEVSGELDLRKGKAEVSCLFVKEWGLPSEFAFEVPTGRTKPVLTAHGVEVGLLGANAGTFELEKGDCVKSCRGARECFGDRMCNGECCVPVWADECETFDTEGCGRCCALSAGARAADCVQNACVK
jgi:hypothetical protein